MPLRSDTQALHFIASVPLIQRREKCCSREEKAPSRSSFSVSMYVVLKTRYVNPISTYIDLSSTYVAQTYLPLVHNFYPYTEQQPNIGSLIGQYRFTPHTSTHSLHIPLFIYALRLHQIVVPIHGCTLHLPLIEPRSRVRSLQQLVPSVARTLTPSALERKIWGAFPWKVVSLPARLNI